MKIGSGYFSWARLEKEMKYEENPEPGMIHLWEWFLGQINSFITFLSTSSVQPEQAESHLKIWVRFSWNRNGKEKTNTK